MATLTNFNLYFKKRVNTGDYEFEEASSSVSADFDADEDAHEALKAHGMMVVNAVHGTLGVPVKGSRFAVEASRSPKDAPQPPHPNQQVNQQANSGNGGQSQISRTKEAQKIWEGTGKVKGQNAETLAGDLCLLASRGEEVPEEQIARLPQAKQAEVRKYIQNPHGDAQEPAGPHDDPPVGGEPKNEAEAQAAEDTAPGGVLADDDLDAETMVAKINEFAGEHGDAGKKVIKETLGEFKAAKISLLPAGDRQRFLDAINAKMAPAEAQAAEDDDLADMI